MSDQIQDARQLLATALANLPNQADEGMEVQQTNAVVSMAYSFAGLLAMIIAEHDQEEQRQAKLWKMDRTAWLADQEDRMDEVYGRDG